MFAEDAIVFDRAKKEITLTFTNPTISKRIR